MKNDAAGPHGEERARVLLVDDQEIIYRALERLLAEETDIELHYCQDPTEAIETALRVQPTVILQDLVMPEVDGMTLVRFFRANPSTRDIPMIVLSSKEEAETKAEAFACGANDYVVKLPDRLELLARIRYHSRGYLAHQERNRAWKQLEDELAQAANYVRGLLPAPRESAPRTDWRFIPSAQLGGDAFGYHWVDDDHFAVYLLDVCGHGIGSALLSVSAMNVLRGQTLPGADFCDPGDVLTRLNEAFPMEQHGDRFFTAWYGVMDRRTRMLRYASGGHPPAALVCGPSPEHSEVLRLRTPGLVIGCMPEATYRTTECHVPSFARLYVFSDGIHEVPDVSSGKLWTLDAWLELLRAHASGGATDLNGLCDAVRAVQGADAFEDDVSLLEVVLDEG